MKCNFCGNEISETDKFCNNCGGPVTKADVYKQPVPQESMPVNVIPDPTVNVQKPDEIDNTNVQAIVILVLSIICCCISTGTMFNAPFSLAALILSIVSLSKSGKAKSLWYSGEKKLAVVEVQSVRKLNKAGWILFACAAFICIMLFVLAIVVGQYSFEYYEDFYTVIPYATDFSYYFN